MALSLTLPSSNLKLPICWRKCAEQQEQWTANRRVIFLFPSSRASRSSRAPREISRSPRLAHKAPVMQATDAALIRGRGLIEGGAYSSKYGTHQQELIKNDHCVRKMSEQRTSSYKKKKTTTTTTTEADQIY